MRSTLIRVGVHCVLAMLPLGCSSANFSAGGDADDAAVTSTADGATGDDVGSTTPGGDDGGSDATSVGADGSASEVGASDAPASDAAVTDSSGASDATTIGSGDATTIGSGDATVSDSGHTDAAAADAPDATAAGDAEAGCSPVITCYPDRDGDGYATLTGAISGCGCPTGYVSKMPATGEVDCNDENAQVHPHETAYFDKPYCVPGTSCATKSFDYDCSGTEDPALPNSFPGCGSYPSCSGAGWASTTPAACGTADNYTTCTATLTLSCSATSKLTTQTCR